MTWYDDLVQSQLVIIRMIIITTLSDIECGTNARHSHNVVMGYLDVERDTLTTLSWGTLTLSETLSQRCHGVP